MFSRRKPSVLELLAELEDTVVRYHHAERIYEEFNKLPAPKGVFQRYLYNEESFCRWKARNKLKSRAEELIKDLRAAGASYETISAHIKSEPDWSVK